MTHGPHFSLDLSAALVLHSATIAHLPDGALLLGDERRTDWHLIAIDDDRFAGAQIDLTIRASPVDGASTNLYFNLYGGKNLASITPDGAVLPGALADIASASWSGDTIVVHLRWTSDAARIALGLSDARGAGFFAGQGEPQWIIRSADVTLAPPSPSPNEQLIFVDVGAAGGLDGKWKPHLDLMHCVFIEPDPAAASKLARDIHRYPSAQVLPYGLSDVSGMRQLYVTAFDQCSSLREPNAAVLARWEVAPLFDVQRTIPVDCRRYDEIVDAPAPDCIKIDVQGMEYEVLDGFGAYLDTVLGIELESQFYELYKGQKLFGDLVAKLHAHGLWLRSIAPQFNFGRDVAEINAFFTRDPASCGVAARKLDLIHRVWKLEDYAWGANLKRLILDSPR